MMAIYVGVACSMRLSYDLLMDRDGIFASCSKSKVCFKTTG